jgi:hypothetical protein
MSLAASLTLGLTAGCICRLAMFMFSSLQCLILTHGLNTCLVHLANCWCVLVFITCYTINLSSKFTNIY